MQLCLTLTAADAFLNMDNIYSEGRFLKIFQAHVYMNVNFNEG